MVMITIYARQKKRHRCIEQTFGLYGRRRGWDDLREQHRNMYIIKCETDRQPRLAAWGSGLYIRPLTSCISFLLVLSHSVISYSLWPHGLQPTRFLCPWDQARILEWVAIPSSRGSSWPWNRTQVSHMAGGFFAIWATREAREYKASFQYLSLNTRLREFSLSLPALWSVLCYSLSKLHHPSVYISLFHYPGSSLGAAGTKFASDVRAFPDPSLLPGIL